MPRCYQHAPTAPFHAPLSIRRCCTLPLQGLTAHNDNYKHTHIHTHFINKHISVVTARTRARTSLTPSGAAARATPGPHCTHSQTHTHTHTHTSPLLGTHPTHPIRCCCTCHSRASLHTLVPTVGLGASAADAAAAGASRLGFWLVLRDPSTGDACAAGRCVFVVGVGVRWVEGAGLLRSGAPAVAAELVG